VELSPASEALHRRVADALERGARTRRQSRVLLARHRALGVAVHQTLAAIHERRRALAGRRRSETRC
jgi:hypothetical protein